jgi:lysyl-tRNA synthetase class 2
VAKQESTGSGAALEAARREKLARIQEMGIDPWGQRFDDHSPISEVRARDGEIVVTPAEEEGRQPNQDGPKVRVAGRIMLQRKKGKLIFIDLKDWSGTIQLFIGRNQIGEENWELARCFDLGDIVGVDGELRRTKTGELTIFVEKLHFLSKSI